MSRPLTIYLAGPEVFLPEALELGQRKKALCEAYGFEGLYPLDNAVESGAPGDILSRRIYDANIAMIRRADLAIFNLTPLRGSGADAGTVFELGLAAGLGKPLFGYTNDGRDLLDRVRNDVSATLDGGVWRDAEGLMIEDFGNADNLMLDEALAASGNPIVRRAVPVADRLRDLTGFEDCLKLARTQ